MIVGSVPIFDGPVARYVARSGVAMLSIQYRLAPEHPHPTPVEDAYAGLVWLAEHAEQLGVDPDRLAVMGDSAGGGLAAGLAILARDRSGPRLAHQLLIYPMLDDRNTTPDPQIVPFAVWSYDDNITGWDALLGAGHEHRDVDPSAAPARIADADRTAAGLHRGRAARHLPRRGRPVRAHPQPGRRSGRTAPAPGRAPRIRRDRLRLRRRPPGTSRPRADSSQPLSALDRPDIAYPYATGGSGQ